MSTQPGIHVTTTVGQKAGQPAFGVHVSQRHPDGTLDQIVQISFPTQAEQEQARDQLLDLVARLLRPDGP